MPKAKIRLEVPETNSAYDVVVDLDANPMQVAQGLAAQLKLGPGNHYLRLRDSFVIRDGSSLEIVADTVEPFHIIGKSE